jgi:hypothetical protein
MRVLCGDETLKVERIAHGLREQTLRAVSMAIKWPSCARRFGAAKKLLAASRFETDALHGNAAVVRDRLPGRTVSDFPAAGPAAPHAGQCRRRALYDALKGPKDLMPVKGADHNDWPDRVNASWWQEAILRTLGETR